MSGPLAHVAELWRYPVKGMRGEPVDSLEVIPDGIAQDRRYAFKSSGAPAGKPMLTSRERAAMLLYSAHVSANGVEVVTPDQQRFPVDDPALLDHLETHLPQGHRIMLQRSGDTDGPFTDVRPIALVSRQTLTRVQASYERDVDSRRFRANVVVNFSAPALAELTGDRPPLFPEDALTGHVLQIGETCRLRVLERVPRCRIVTLDPVTAEPDPALMKHLDRQYSGRVGVYAAVVTPGPICRGAVVSFG